MKKTACFNILGMTDRYKWVEFNAETRGAQCFYRKLLNPVASKNDEFRAGMVRNWRKFVEKGNQHAESMEFMLPISLISARARIRLKLGTKIKFPTAAGFRPWEV